MKAMILAAGRGERMRPLTDHTPKPLLVVGGKPLIVWHIERLANAGFSELVINHAHLGEQIEDALGDGTQWGVKIQYSPEQVALETAGGIANAMHLLGNVPFLVVNGDVFTDFDFRQINLQKDYLAQLVLVNNPIEHPAGDFCIEDGALKNSGQNRLTFSGIGVYHPQMFVDILAGKPAKLAPLLRRAIENARAGAMHYQGIWHDIGTPERLLALNNVLKNNHLKNR